MVELYDIKGKLEEIEKQVKVMAALRVERIYEEVVAVLKRVVDKSASLLGVINGKKRRENTELVTAM